MRLLLFKNHRLHQQSSAANLCFLPWHDILQGGQNSQRWAALSLLAACLHECTSIWVKLSRVCFTALCGKSSGSGSQTFFRFLPQLWSRPLTLAAQGRHRLTTNIYQICTCINYKNVTDISNLRSQPVSEAIAKVRRKGNIWKERFLYMKCALYLETSPSFPNISLCGINRIPREEMPWMGIERGWLRFETTVDCWSLSKSN